MNPFDCGVYIIRNNVNGKCYIGSARSFKKRWSDHRRQLTDGIHTNPKLQAAWNKYGSDVFEFEAVTYCPKDQLLWQEQIALNAFKATEAGYNLCPTAGNRLGSPQSQVSKDRIRQAMIGNKNAKGMKHTSITRSKLSMSSKGNQRAAGSKGRLGQSNSQEHRQRLSNSHKGVKLSEEHKQRISEGRRLYLQNKLSVALNEQAVHG